MFGVSLVGRRRFWWVDGDQTMVANGRSFNGQRETIESIRATPMFWCKHGKEGVCGVKRSVTASDNFGIQRLNERTVNKFCLYPRLTAAEHCPGDSVANNTARLLHNRPVYVQLTGSQSVAKVNLLQIVGNLKRSFTILGTGALTDLLFTMPTARRLRTVPGAYRFLETDHYLVVKLPVSSFRTGDCLVA